MLWEIQVGQSKGSGESAQGWRDWGKRSGEGVYGQKGQLEQSPQGVKYSNMLKSSKEASVDTV